MSPLKKTYRISNFELCGMVSDVVEYMTRDNVEFTGRGITTAMRDDFKALGDAFEVFPPDEDYLGIISDIVIEKTVLRNSITLMIQKISGYFEQEWGINSGKYKRLGINGLTSMKELEFLFRARAVARLAEEFLTELTPIGLTQAEIDALEAEAELFEGKINETSVAKSNREDKTEERTKKGNELYEYLVKYARVGKLIWENVNQSKYDDYVIYETSHPGLSKPQNLAAIYVPGPPPTNNLTWDAVAGATYYEIFVSIVNIGSPSGDYTMLYTSSTNSFSVPVIINKRNYYKIKAKNETQTSVYSDEVWVDC